MPANKEILRESKSLCSTFSCTKCHLSWNTITCIKIVLYLSAFHTRLNKLCLRTILRGPRISYMILAQIMSNVAFLFRLFLWPFILYMFNTLWIAWGNFWEKCYLFTGLFIDPIAPWRRCFMLSSGARIDIKCI